MTPEERAEAAARAILDEHLRWEHSFGIEVHDLAPHIAAAIQAAVAAERALLARLLAQSANRG